MSVAGVSSTSFMNQNTVTSQNQQQNQNQFRSLTQQLQSGSLATEQTTAVPQSPLAVSSVASPVSTPPAGWAGAQLGTKAHGHGHHHHHGHVRADSDTASDTESADTPSLGQLGQAIQAGNSSSAQQAYGSVQQDLDQIALNSDLITAQSAALQASSLSFTV